MRIATSTTSNLVLEQIQRLSREQAHLQRQVATGQRLFAPADDPAAAGRLVANGIEQSALRQNLRSAAAAGEYAQTSYTALTQLKRLSDRAGELAVLGTGISGGQAMAAYAQEVDQLLEQAVTLANTRFRHDHVFAGTALDSPPYVPGRDGAGRITAVTYEGDAARLLIPVGEGAVIAPLPDHQTSQGVGDFINRLVALRDQLQAGDAAGVAALRGPLETSEDRLVAALSEHGAVQLRIELTRERQQARLIELDRLASAEADVDLPATIVRLNQTSQAYEAALASAANFLRMSLLDYLR